MNGSWSKEWIDSLFCGSFCKHFLMNDLSQTVTYGGKSTSASTMPWQVSSWVSFSKGGLPEINQKAKIPNPQTSTLKSWVSPRTIQGGRQSSVPQTVSLLRLVQIDHPKSAIFTLPPERSKFSGLISRWMIFLECRQASPSMTCFSMAATKPSLNLPNFFNFPYNSPSGACYRMRQTELLSQKQPYSFKICGWLRAD